MSGNYVKNWKEKYIYTNYIGFQNTALYKYTHTHAHAQTQSATCFGSSPSSDTLEYSNLLDYQTISTNTSHFFFSLDCFTLKMKSSFKISVYRCAQPIISEYLNLQQPELSNKTPWSQYTRTWKLVNVILSLCYINSAN